MDMKEKQQIVGELEALQLEETRDRVMSTRAKREQRAAQQRHMVQIVQRNAAIEKATQADCWHKKGGKGTQGLNRGDDPKFAVIKHMLSHGPIIVVCQRCGCVWRKPERLPKGYTAEERKQYMLDLAEYNKALNFPTDNEMSGSQIFVITEGEAAA
jgi:hypothetical protein